MGHLVALADERHFARAAERVHLSQPAFSRSIQSLERDVGMRLFDRDTGEVKPTPAGTFLIERARRLLFDARGLQQDTALYRESKLGNTAFGAGPFPAATIMPLAISSLRQQYPGVGLRLETSDWQRLHDRLLAEDIEFFVADIRDVPVDPRIAVAPLGRQAAHLYARVGHPLAGRPITLAVAWPFGIATTKLPRGVGDLFAQRVGLPTGEVPALVVQCDDIGLLCTLALTTDTLIGIPDAWVRHNASARSLIQLSIEDLPEVYAEMGVVTLANRTASPMARRAIDCIRKVANELDAAGA